MRCEKKWLVVVEYGATARHNLDHLLFNKTDKYKCEVVRVRNDITLGSILPNPNEAFEFSGYQEGLARILQHYSSLSSDNSELSLTVAFVNDTVESGHISPLTSYLIDLLFDFNYNEQRTPLFTGLRMPVRGSIKDITGETAYLSTWAFSLSAPVSALKFVKFYGSDDTISRFEVTTLPTLPQSYRLAVKEWLEPTRFLQGWYKAIPGQTLSEYTLRRKTLSIYLEHTLPRRLEEIGFHITDVGDCLTGLRLFRLTLLRAFDRVYVNILKIFSRINSVVRRNIPL